jgi:hypothetical protein
MSSPISETEARYALSSIEWRRQQVVAEIDVPWWYWFFLACGWVALGVLADYGPAWATVAATVAFGATHSVIAQRVLSGRRASPQLSVHTDLVSRWVPIIVIGFLIVMTAATVGFAVLLDADGARHPATLASIFVAALVLCGGPALMGLVRRRAVRRINAER